MPTRDDICREVGQLLTADHLTLSVAESCTGGLVSHWITEVAGSSDYYKGSVIAYHDQVKERVLGVERETLRAYGAVSDQTARAMAEGVRRVLGTEIGLSTTGIAGPGGGTPEKPVGLVFVALAAGEGTWCERHIWEGGRSDNKMFSAAAALRLLRRYLTGQLPQPACVGHGSAS